MAEVLFGQSYYLRFDPKLWEAMQPYPPLGTLYAASYLRSRGYEVALFDAMLANSEQRWAEALDRHQPRYAVLYEDNFNYLSKMCLLRMREAAFTMAEMAKQRGCTVIACGADATDHADGLLPTRRRLRLAGRGRDHLGRADGFADRPQRAAGRADPWLGDPAIRQRHPAAGQSTAPHSAATWTACLSPHGIWSTFRRISSSGASDTAIIR